MLKTVVLFNIFVKTTILFLQDSLMNRCFKRTAFDWIFLLCYKCLYCQFWSILWFLAE